MENLAYLYILAEEAEHQAEQSDRHHHKKQAQADQNSATRRSNPANNIQTVDGVKAALDCDRANPSYPTFYL